VLERITQSLPLHALGRIVRRSVLLDGHVRQVDVVVHNVLLPHAEPRGGEARKPAPVQVDLQVWVRPGCLRANKWRQEAPARVGVVGAQVFEDGEREVLLHL
jgi:hypothetical protein